MLNENTAKNQQTNENAPEVNDQPEPIAENSDTSENSAVDTNQTNEGSEEINPENIDNNKELQSESSTQSESDSETDSSEPESEELSELELENQELKAKNEQILLHMADFENRAKRAEQEVKNARQYSIAGFAKDMLAVADNLGRALEAVTGEGNEESDANLNALIEGVQMTQKELHNQLSKHGVVQIDPTGEKFDPNFHQAMFEVPNSESPNNTVISVQQKGYKIGDRILRPALVGVSKNPESETKKESKTENQETASEIQNNQANDNSAPAGEPENLDNEQNS